MTTPEDQAKDTVTPTSQAAKAKTPQQTDYTILRHVSSGPDYWEITGEVVAASSDAAVRTGSDGASGIYVAIPTRSFKRVKVSIEKVERVKLEDA